MNRIRARREIVVCEAIPDRIAAHRFEGWSVSPVEKG